MSDTYEAPCKINLSLRVLGKRPDGFHEVETLMLPVPLCDELHLDSSPRTELICTTPGVPTDESNLVLKALRLLETKAGRPLPVRVELVKRVPHGAGLGGGSSDAATMLMAVNERENLGLSPDTLVELAGQLGSDVGFFIRRGPCLCTGRGEKVTAAPDPGLSGLYLVLLKPTFGVSTPQAYKSWAGSRPLEGLSYAPQRVGSVELVNDLERPVFEKYLFLAEMKMWLLNRPGVLAAMMSGSGSTMFALVDSEAAAAALCREALVELDPTLWTWAGRL